jgi:C4-dicarboxylate transporter, DctQ subunit
MLSNFDRWLEKIETAFSNVALLGIVFLIGAVCYEMLMRGLFDRPQSWVIEFTEYAMLYITFLGAATLQRQGGHVSVDLLTDALNDTWRRRLGIVSAAICLVVMLVLTWFAALATLDARRRGIYKPTIMEFPTWIVLAVIPVGSLLLSLRTAHRLLSLLAGVTHAKGR